MPVLKRTAAVCAYAERVQGRSLKDEMIWLVLAWYNLGLAEPFTGKGTEDDPIRPSDLETNWHKSSLISWRRSQAIKAKGPTELARAFRLIPSALKRGDSKRERLCGQSRASRLPRRAGAQRLRVPARYFLCSTPFGITEFGTTHPDHLLTWKAGAQRLSASLRLTSSSRRCRQSRAWRESSCRREACSRRASSVSSPRPCRRSSEPSLYLPKGIRQPTS